MTFFKSLYSMVSFILNIILDSVREIKSGTQKSIQSYTGWQKEQSLKALVEQTYTKHGTMVYGLPLMT